MSRHVSSRYVFSMFDPWAPVYILNKLVYVLNNKNPVGSMSYPVGFRKPMTRARENPCPRLRAWVLTGTGAGCMGKPQGSPSYSLNQHRLF